MSVSNHTPKKRTGSKQSKAALRKAAATERLDEFDAKAVAEALEKQEELKNGVILTTNEEVLAAMEDLRRIIDWPASEEELRRLAVLDNTSLKALGSLLGMGSRLDEPAPKEAKHPVRLSPREMSIREYLMWKMLKIRNKQSKLVRLLLNETQKDYETKCGKRAIVLKARQLGITTYVAARFFINCITRPGTLAVQVAHDQHSAEEIFRIVHRLLENLPRQFRKGALKTSRANVRQIIFTHLDSEYRVETAAGPNAGRGLTIHNLHCSEVARWPGDVAATLASLRAAVPPDGEIVLESTANGAFGPFYDEWQRAEETGYTRHFYPWWWEPSYVRDVPIAEFAERELELMALHGLTPQQIAFRREMFANFGGRAAEEYAESAESCFLASGECFFDVEIAHKRWSEAPQPYETTDAGRIMRWLPAAADIGGTPREYVIGVDPAGGGTEGDYSVLQVVDRASGVQCAELRGHWSPAETAARAAELAREYNQALLAVERNNHGHTVIHALTDTHKYFNLYSPSPKCNYGWYTTKATRPQMLDHLASLLRNSPNLFNSRRLLEECKTFIRHAYTEPSAASGTHDDTVMAMAIAQAVRSQDPQRQAAEMMSLSMSA